MVNIKNILVLFIACFSIQLVYCQEDAREIERRAIFLQEYAKYIAGRSMENNNSTAISDTSASSSTSNQDNVMSNYTLPNQPKEQNDGWYKYKTIIGVEHYALQEDGTWSPYMKDRGEYIIETRVYNGKRQYCLIHPYYGTRIPVKKSPVRKYNSCCCSTGSCKVIWCFDL